MTANAETVRRARPVAAALALATLCVAARAAPAPCPVDEKSLLGAWGSRGTGDSFETIAFRVDDEGRTFQSWRHQRPEIGNGTWMLADCVLRIGHATEPQLSWVFHVEHGPSGELRLREDGTRRQERYRRMP